MNKPHWLETAFAIFCAAVMILCVVAFIYNFKDVRIVPAATQASSAAKKEGQP